MLPVWFCVHHTTHFRKPKRQSVNCPEACGHPPLWKWFQGLGFTTLSLFYLSQKKRWFSILVTPSRPSCWVLCPPTQLQEVEMFDPTPTKGSHSICVCENCWEPEELIGSI
jgi:hypothetical protein